MALKLSMNHFSSYSRFSAGEGSSSLELPPSGFKLQASGF